MALAGPWETFLEARKGRAPEAWTLVLSSASLDPGSLLKDEIYQKLAAGPDWSVALLDATQAQDLAEGLGAQWALLAPGGTLAGHGHGAPTGEVLLETLHRTGARPRFEARRAFLDEHPGQGEARLEELAFQARLLRAKLAWLDGLGIVQIPAWHASPEGLSQARIALEGRGSERTDELFAGLVSALRAVTGTADWTREADRILPCLTPFDLTRIPALRRLARDLAPVAERAFAADPEDGARLRLLMELLDAADRLPTALSARIPRVPGVAWPGPRLLATMLEPYGRRKRYEDELRLLADLTPDAPPEPLNPRAWEAYLRVRTGLGTARALALASMGSLDAALAARGEAAAWGDVRGPLGLFVASGLRASRLDAAAWDRLLRPEPGPVTPPPMPVPPAAFLLRLQGQPPWLMDWVRLRDSEAMALWAPAELRWDVASPGEHRAARERFGWDAAPRWTLLQGGELLASGTTCPTAQALAAVLASHGTPLLERFAQAIARDPDCVLLRRARAAQLLRRMPDARLEALLAEDAARARLDPGFGSAGSFRPDPDLWGAQAQALLPELETALRTWPSDPGLWEAWIGWAHLHPSRPSIVALAQGMPHWPPGPGWRLGLPLPVHRAVAAELRRQGAYRTMLDWFQDLWNGLDLRPGRDLHAWETRGIQERRLEEAAAVHQPLREALQALGMTDRLREVDRVFRELTAHPDPPGR